MLVDSGALDEGLDELRQALAQSVVLENKHCEFHAHFNLWKAYEKAGDKDRMKFAFQSAGHFVKFIDDTSVEAREFRRVLLEQKAARRPSRRGRPAS